MKRFIAVYFNDGKDPSLPWGLTFIGADNLDEALPDLLSPRGSIFEVVIDGLGHLSPERKTSLLRVTTEARTKIVPVTWKAAQKWVESLRHEHDRHDRHVA